MKSFEGQPNVRVLLVEDSLPVRQRIGSLIEESGHATIVGAASTSAAALALFHEYQPDAVVLDLHLEEGSGDAVLEEIKQTRPTCEVIVLTNFDFPEYRESCRLLGADHFFQKSRDFERVPEVLAELGRAATRKGRILIADDEATVGDVLKKFLQATGYDCVWVPDAAEALQRLNRSRFDLLIADINMPGNQHLELVQELSRMLPGLPVILLTGAASVASAAAAVRLRARAYLQKPPDLAELKMLVQEFIVNYRVHQAVHRKWDEFQEISMDLNLQLTVPRIVAADRVELMDLDCLFRALSDVVRVGKVSSPSDTLQPGQHLELVNAVRETISVLEKTKRSFKSRQLGHLRERLETLVDDLGLEAAITAAHPGDGFGGPAHAAPVS